MQTFNAGEEVPSHWYEAPNLHPMFFAVDVETDIVEGVRHVWPIRSMGDADYVIKGDGAIDPKKASPVRFDPECQVHPWPRSEARH